MLLIKIKNPVTVQQLKPTFTMPRTLSVNEEYEVIREDFDMKDGKRYFISENEYIRYTDNQYEGHTFYVQNEPRINKYWEVSVPKAKESMKLDFHFTHVELFQHFTEEEIPTLDFKLRVEVV